MVVGEGGTGLMAWVIPIGRRGVGAESCCGEPPEKVLAVDGVRMWPPILLDVAGGALPCRVSSG